VIVAEEEFWSDFAPLPMPSGLVASTLGLTEERGWDGGEEARTRTERLLRGSVSSQLLPDGG